MIRSRPMNSFRKQRGMSMLGGLVIVMMSAVLLITALKLAPVYMEYYKIVDVVDQVKQDPSLKGATKDKILSALSKRFNTNDVKSLTKDDYRVTKVQGRNAYDIEFYYEVRTPLFGNLSIVAEFQRSEEVGE
jgi:hypothetical protein